jgi:hypothetical protein
VFRIWKGDRGDIEESGDGARQVLLFEANLPHPLFDPGIAPVFRLNSVFALPWVVSGVLFQHGGEHDGKLTFSNFPIGGRNANRH